MSTPLLTEITNLAIDLIGVTKTYSRKVQALRGVNIQVGRGEIFGLLGPNGAGKSTLVKIMMTVVRPNVAMGTFLGRPLGNRKKLRAVGYLPENHRFPHYLTAEQVLDYYARLASVPRADRRQRIPQLLDRVGLTAWTQARVGKFSKGMQQRLGIAQALMNDPEMLILDEPTDGIDPLGRREVRELLLELRSRRKTIFLNSHLLSELELICDRVAILSEGLVVRQGTLSELTERTFEYRIEMSGDLKALSVELEGLGGHIRDGMVIVTGQDSERVNRIIDLLRSRHHLIKAVEPRHLTLEDVFVEALGLPLPSAGGAKVARPVGGKQE